MTKSPASRSLRNVWAGLLVTIAAAGLGETETRELRLESATIAELQAAMERGALSAESLVRLHLARIDAYDRKGPALRAFLTVSSRALEDARALDSERKRSGARGPLHGIPIVVKDNIDTARLPTTGGSTGLEGSHPLDDAFVVQRLTAAGAIILGKANLDELARDTVGLSSLGGQTRNPYDPDRGPGGSSGGTAAAVAAVMAVAGLGTETGVSIRNPAADNNLVGLAPTEGLVSRDGVIPISFTQDRVGPLARSVADAATLLTVMAGLDPADLATLESVGRIPKEPYESFAASGALAGARIGVLREMFRAGSDHEAALAVIEGALGDLRGAEALVVDPVATGLDLFDLLKDARLSPWEYGRALNHYLATRGPEAPIASVRAWIDSREHLPRLNELLEAALAVGPLERHPDYIDRLDRRRRLRETLVALMDRHDLDALVYPMKTIPPQPIGRRHPQWDNPLSSCTGLPAIVVPAGFTENGLPVGLEILARPFDEPRLIGLAHGYEQVTRHRRSPTATPTLPGESVEYQTP